MVLPTERRGFRDPMESWKIIWIHGRIRRRRPLSIPTRFSPKKCTEPAPGGGKLDQSPGQAGFPAARFAHQPQGLAGNQVQVHAGHRLGHPLFAGRMAHSKAAYPKNGFFFHLPPSAHLRQSRIPARIAVDAILPGRRQRRHLGSASLPGRRAAGCKGAATDGGRHCRRLSMYGGRYLMGPAIEAGHGADQGPGIRHAGIGK